MVPVGNRQIGFPPVLLLAAYSGFTLNTALPCVPSQTPAKCEADQVNVVEKTEGHTDSYSNI